jgi:hypothetical protein
MKSRNFLLPRESRVIICGTARNVEKHVTKYFEILNSSFSSFKEVVFLVCESFSTDKTLLALESVKGLYVKLDYFSDNKVSLEESLRAVRIASARNSLQDRVKEKYSTFDYVVMADMDGVNRDLTQESVDSCWDYPVWDVVFANQPFRYYDIWALRAIGWSENDCWQEYRELLQSMSPKKAREIAVTSKMKSLSPNMPLLPVESAFGGLAIYTMNAFLSGKYIGLSSFGYEVCEHVAFHQDLRKRGLHLYIAPNLVNLLPKTQKLEFLLNRHNIGLLKKARV